MASIFFPQLGCYFAYSAYRQTRTLKWYPAETGANCGASRGCLAP
jgi:hypothetical protein